MSRTGGRHRGRLGLLLGILALVLPLAACVSTDADRRTGSPQDLLAPPDRPRSWASSWPAYPPASSCRCVAASAG